MTKKKAKTALLSPTLVQICVMLRIPNQPEKKKKKKNIQNLLGFYPVFFDYYVQDFESLTWQGKYRVVSAEACYKHSAVCLEQ